MQCWFRAQPLRRQAMSYFLKRSLLGALNHHVRSPATHLERSLGQRPSGEAARKGIALRQHREGDSHLRGGWGSSDESGPSHHLNVTA